MIRLDLNMEHDEVHQFVLTVFVQFVFLQKNFRLQKDSASLFTRSVINNIILSCFNFCENSNWKEQIVFMNICKVK